MRKLKEKLIIRILAMAVLVILLFTYIGYIFSSSNTVSEVENRTLATVPSFTLDSILESNFQSGFETALSDHFPLRDSLRSLKTSIMTLTGHTDSNGVYKSSDGYLIQGFTGADENIMNTQIEAINNFTQKYTDKTSYMLIAPTASDIYSSKLPSGAPVKSEEQYINTYMGKLDSNIKTINVNKNLASHSNEEIYYKTDHHWTSLGAYYAYKQTASVMNLNTAGDKYESQPVTDDFTGSLAKLSGFDLDEKETINVYFNGLSEFETTVYYKNEQKKTTSMFSSEALEGSDKYLVFLGQNTGEIIINSTSTVDKNLLIFKDSYANCFIPFLAPHYQKIVVVDPRYYYEDIDDLIKTEKITDIMYLYNAQTLSEDESLATVLSGD